VRRLQTVGLFASLLVVAVLIGSMMVGLGADPKPTEAEATREVGAPPADRVRVEVLNAAGVPGLARAATHTLRQRGLDVVYFGNAGSRARDSSVVIDRVGKPETAGQVAKALGIATVESVPDTTLYVDVTVILGGDWKDRPIQPLPGLSRPPAGKNP
jgi:hypothetical protein